MTSRLRLSRVSDPIDRNELHTSQEEILREHIHNLSRQVVSKSIAKRSFPIAPSHSDVDDFVPVVDHIDARRYGNLPPVNIPKGNSIR